MSQTKIPRRSDYETFFSLFKAPGRRPVRQGLSHPFVDATLVPTPLANFSGQGAFALVYRLRESSGREWAVRCPIRIPDDSSRGLTKALSRWTPPPTLSPHLVLPTAIEDAIYVAGEWIDVTVMPWVAGETLEDTINGNSRPDWNRLADDWQQLLRTMSAEGVAHGDLQPKNVIRRSDGTLTLVDYDSFLIQGAIGGVCPVGGLRGYGHPMFTSGRSVRRFDRDMDTFAGLVMLLTLRALAVDPSLLRPNADDGFVIPDEELTSPGRVVARLERMAEPVGTLAKKLRKLCADQNGGLRPWSEIVASGYRPCYELNLPLLPPVPARQPYSPLFS